MGSAAKPTLSKGIAVSQRPPTLARFYVALAKLRHLILLMALAAIVGIVVYLAAAPSKPDAAAHSGWLDMHVHTAGIGAGSDAFVNRQMRDSWRFPIYLRAFGVTEQEVLAQGDSLIVARISAGVAASTRIGKAVVLALDGVVGADGELDRQTTQVYVPNDLVATETQRYANLCFGASVNPYRRDAIERLRAAVGAGAVLLKWIPNIMHIDPADEALRPFYRELVRLRLPLLTHVGQERSFATAKDWFGDPQRLTLPLALGVTVIAAHIATTGENEGEANFDRILPMFALYPNLYADISSLTQINKRGYLKRALAVPGLEQRLIYGTDWPLQFSLLVSPYYHADRIGLPAAKSLAAIDNAWDRDVALKEALGVPQTIFARGAQLLAVERCG